MATYKKGESMKDQRLVVSASFEQKGDRKGYNVAISRANDVIPEGGRVMTDPMLVYDKYEGKDGKMKDTYTASYSASQWEKIQEAANKDGDAMVFNGDVFPNKHGKGLVVNTNSLSTPDVAFDSEAHKENTLAARAEARKEKAAKAEQSVEQEDALERE